MAQFRSHPGVVTCLGFFRERGTAYLAMEYEEGLPLSELLTNREAAGSPLQQGELLRLAKQLLDSLATVHEAGVLHRDIKPSNILIRRADDWPVLIDFGAAKQDFVRYTKSNAPHTQGYAAIEQLEANGELGPWTDLYGLGAVLWRIVAGGTRPRGPLVPVDALSRMTAIFRGQDDPQPSARTLGLGRFSNCVLEAVDKCLELEPTDRPADCSELLGLLSVPAKEEPPHMVPSRRADDGNEDSRGEEESLSAVNQPSEFGAKRGRSKRASRTALVGIATTLLALVASGLVWHYGRSDQRGVGNSVSEVGSLLQAARSDVEFGSGLADVDGLRGAAEQGDSLSKIVLTLNRVFESRAKSSDPYVSYYSPQDVEHTLPPEVIEAVEWLRNAAEKGEVQAQLWLGWMHWNGRGLRRDDSMAVEWYRKAAALGNPEAQTQLGTAYYFGRGVPEDKAKGLDLYRKAAALGSFEAQMELGHMYRFGRGVPQDYTEAVKRYREAAEQGVGVAQYLLGQMYKKGQGVPISNVRAYAWMNLAAAQGYSNSWQERDRLLSEMTTTEIAEGQSLSRKIAGAIADRNR